MSIRRIIKKYPAKITIFIFIILSLLFFAYKVFIYKDTDKMILEFDRSVKIKWLPNTVSRFSSDISFYAKEYDINAGLVAIIMTLESGGYTRANSGLAHGLMQVTPQTAEDISTRLLSSALDSYDLFDTKTSIEFGVAYLRYLRDEFCSKDIVEDYCVELIAAGYNGGPGAANSLFKGEGLPAVETASYSRNAMNMWRERGSSFSPTYERWLVAGGSVLVDKAANEIK